MTRIRVSTNCVAERYRRRHGDDNERIVEFMDTATRQSGLISFLRQPDRYLRIDLYNLDTHVLVHAPECHLAWPENET